MPVEGDLIAQRFELITLAGEGGMGSVWRARDRSNGNILALKLIDARAQADRFVREASVLAELSHPGVVRYVAHGAADGRHLFLAMEWVDGEDLSQRLAREGLTISQSVEIARQVAQVLAFAHERGVVHRDVKPSNIMLDGGRVDRARVLDFGVARRLRDSSEALTAAGAILGTVGYMAPEQAQAAATVDARADVFALGCVLFECITGRPVFEGSQLVAVLMKVLLEEPPRLCDVREDVPEALDALVARMLAKLPDDRPADGAELVRELNDLDLASPSRVPAPTASLRPPALARREQKLWSVILAHRALSASAIDTTAPTISDAAEPLGDLLTSTRRAIEPFDARVEALSDGSLVAVLSGHGWAPDLAHRAARCSLALNEAFPTAPMALATGRGDDSGRVPAGDVVERAARLASAAAGAHVRVDDVTAGFLDLRFEVRGDTVSLQLVRERERIAATRTVLGREPPCVGRERELGSLIGVWDECVAESVARAVLVTAPAGWGKSRVRYEFLKKIEARGEPVQLWTAYADEMRSGATFGMLAPTVRRAAGIQGGEPLATRREKLAARVARNVEEKHRQRVTAFLGEMIGTQFDVEGLPALRTARSNPIAMADQIRLAWQDWLNAESSEAPVLLVWEDLHWGDAASVSLVDLALKNLKDKPWMVLALARPDVRETFANVWSERGLVTMALAELTPKTSERFVRAVLDKRVSDAEVRAIVERGAGQPLYLEELVRAAADGKLDTVPATVLAMVQSRLEELPDEARRVLRAASVIGRTFWSGAVAAMLGGASRTTEVGRWLDDLCAREVIAKFSESRFAGDEEFAFRHSVMREAAYSTLLDADRVLGHRLAAQWMAARNEAEPAAVAEHHVAAGQRDQAVAWFARASEAALEGNDLGAAVAFGERAVECGAAGQTKGKIRLRQAEAASWLTGAAYGAYADEARGLLERNSSEWLDAVRLRSSAAFRGGDIPTMVAHANELLEVSPSETDASPLVEALGTVSAQAHAAGAGTLAHALRMRAKSVADGPLPVDDHAMAILHDAYARAARYAGELTECLAEMGVAVAGLERAADWRKAFASRLNLADALMQLGRYESAEPMLRNILAEGERLGLRTIVRYALINFGIALWATGRLAEARTHVAASIERATSDDDQRVVAGARTYMARIELLEGDAPASEREARAALAACAVPPLRLHALAVLASALLAQGRVAEALASARDADTIRSDSAMVDEGHTIVRYVFARALHASGDAEGARGVLAAARDEVLRCAEKISSPAERQSFLDDVPDHRDALALAREWGV